jgi:hypothetical protein
LTLFSTLSRVSIAVVLAAMALAVIWLGWRAGGARLAAEPIAGAAG